LVRAGQMSRLGEAERFRSCVWIRGPDRETPVPGGGVEGYLHGRQNAFQSSGTLRAPVPRPGHVSCAPGGWSSARADGRANSVPGCGRVL
jgi:hypothetical protein